MDIIIVSYLQDLFKLSRCLRSLRSNNYFRNSTFKIIVNDSDDVAEKFIRKFRRIPNIKIYKASTVDDTVKTSGPDGWLTQQVLKLAACRIVSTDWYLVLDSDFEIIKNYEISDCDFFINGLAKCELRKITEHRPPFDQYAVFAYNCYAVQSTVDSMILREKPPILLHRSSVEEMLLTFDPGWILENKSCEFHLYWCFILSRQLDSTLYSPTNSWFVLGDFFTENSN
jgi:hypothetical protein